MSDSQIIIATVLVILSIIIPIYYSYKRKKEKAAERSSEALERMQIREYGRNINEQTRAKRT